MVWLLFSIVCSFLCVCVVFLVNLLSISIFVYDVIVIFSRCGLWYLLVRKCIVLCIFIVLLVEDVSIWFILVKIVVVLVFVLLVIVMIDLVSFLDVL